jgi:hypothetical protein
MSLSPYQRLPRRQYWTTAVGGKNLGNVKAPYSKRFPIEGLRVATAGSCFAQEIASRLRKRGYVVIDKEPPPSTLRGQAARDFGYLLYSARYGNIYTARQLLQLASEALGRIDVHPDVLVQEKHGRYVDAFRPSVEPEGVSTEQEVLLQRKVHLRRVRQVLEEADLFVFTFGLTEAWEHKPTGLIYPVAPGVVAGQFDSAVHVFRNFRVREVVDDFIAFRNLAHSVNPAMKFLITVSPIPLAATASDSHVLTATVKSKSVLRAAASELYDEFPDIDYFPSYDLLMTPFLGGQAFEGDQRNVTKSSVEQVMNIFFAEQILTESPLDEASVPSQRMADASPDALVCEEALLDAFAARK